MKDENNLNPFSNGIDSNTTLGVFDAQPSVTPEAVTPVESPVQGAVNVEAAPVDNSATVATTIESAPVESTQTVATTIESTPVESTQTVAPTFGAAPVESTPAVAPTFETAPVDSTQTVAPTFETAPVDSTPAVAPTVETVSVENTVQPVIENAAPVAGAVTETITSEPMVSNNQTVASNQIAQDLVQPTVENTTLPTESDNKKKSPVKLIVILVGILAVLAVGFFCVSNFVLVNGKTIVKTSFVKTFDYLLSSIEKVEKNTLVIDPSKDKMGVSGNISFSSNYKDDSVDLTKLANYKIAYNFASDFSNKTFAFNTSLNKGNETLIDLNTFFKDKLLSLKSSKLSFYTYTMEIDSLPDLEFNQSFNYSDVRALVNKAKNVVVDNINESKITKTSGSRTVGGVTKNYKKISYEFSMNEMYKSIINSYLNDDSAMEILVRLTSSSKDDVKKMLENSLNKANLVEVAYLDVYVDSLFGSFAGLSIRTAANDTSFELDKINNNYQFYFNNFSNGNLKGNYMSDTKTFNVYYAYEDNSFELSIKELSDTKFNVGINITSKGFKANLDMNVDNVVSSDKQSIKLDAKISYTADESTIEFGVNSETNITKDAIVEDGTGIAVKNINDVTLEEQQELTMKFQQIFNNIMMDFIDYSSLYSKEYSSDVMYYNSGDDMSSDISTELSL